MTNIKEAIVNKILFVTLSNIGDVILSLPVLDILRHDYPSARITVISSERAREIFDSNPRIYKFIDYNKHSRLSDKINLLLKLNKEKFDMVVDLRNSWFGLLVSAKYRNHIFVRMSKYIKHMKLRHMHRIPQLKSLPRYPRHDFIYISEEDQQYVLDIMKQHRISPADRLIAIAPGARSHIKRWGVEKFAELADLLIEEFRAKVILVGDKQDNVVVERLIRNSKHHLINLCARTDLKQLACILKKTDLVISNDSAIQHIASYLDVPVLTVFGPTNEFKYGPWSKVNGIAKKDISCRPCEKAGCRFDSMECMVKLKVCDVLTQARQILLNRRHIWYPNFDSRIKRILIIRTDRVGDVLLSTPVIKTLRRHYPYAYIAMLVSPYTKEILDGNPYLDDVIVYDKDGKHKGWYRTIKFSSRLKKKEFDIALILHPTNRAHLISHLAGIPIRIGYDRKMGFLLNRRQKHLKQFGQKHEIDYNLQLLENLGIHAKERDLFMPIKNESERFVEKLFEREGIKESDRLLALHPGASCISKIWPNENFAQVADILVEKFNFRVLIIAGPKDVNLGRQLARNMQHPALDLSGKTSISQLASVLKRCHLFISNDSGPVHIASALGTPVISIFARGQKGLSPSRWGPTGLKSKFLHKDIGCIECLAHNCKKGFKCLKAITPFDVVQAAEEILK